MANNKGWKPGRWKALCDRCGFLYHSDALADEWTGLKVCAPCRDIRNPQDFLKVPMERITPPWTRPEPVDTFVNVPYILGVNGDLYLGLDAIYLNLGSIGLNNDN